MGTPIVVLPRVFNVEQIMQSMNQPQHLPTQQYDNFTMGGNPFFAAMGPPNNEENYSGMTLGYRCLNGSVVCMGTREFDENGDPKNWKQIPNQVCSDQNTRMPGSLNVPHCGASSRDISTGRKFPVWGYVGIGVGAVAIIVLAGVLAKKSA